MKKFLFIIIGFIIYTTPNNSRANDFVEGVYACEVGEFGNNNFNLIDLGQLKPKLEDIWALAYVNSIKLEDNSIFQGDRDLTFDIVMKILNIDKNEIKSSLKNKESKKILFRDIHLAMASIYSQIPEKMLTISSNNDDQFFATINFAKAYNIFFERNYLKKCGNAIYNKLRDENAILPSQTIEEIVNASRINFIVRASETANNTGNDLEKIIDIIKYNPKSVFYYSNIVDDLIALNTNLKNNYNINFFDKAVYEKLLSLNNHLDALKVQINNPEIDYQDCLIEDLKFPFLVPNANKNSLDNLQKELPSEIEFDNYPIEVEINEKGKVINLKHPENINLIFSNETNYNSRKKEKKIDKKKEEKLKQQAIEKFNIAIEKYTYSLQYFPKVSNCKKQTSSSKLVIKLY